MLVSSFTKSQINIRLKWSPRNMSFQHLMRASKEGRQTDIYQCCLPDYGSFCSSKRVWSGGDTDVPWKGQHGKSTAWISEQLDNRESQKWFLVFFLFFFFLFWPSCNEVAECTYPWGSCTLYLNSVLFLIDMQYWCDFNFPEGVKVITEALVKSVTYKEDALEIQLKDGRMVSLWSLFFTKVL